MEEKKKKKNPGSSRGTFHRNSYSSPLDYFFAPEFLLPTITSVLITPEPLSDHCVVSMEVNTPPMVKGPGHWRFDNTLLADQVFVAEMRTHIRDALEEDFPNPNLKWEWTKFKIRENCIAYTINKNREKKALAASMEKRLIFLAEQHDLTDSPDVVHEVQSITRELAEIKQNKANRAIFKAKAKWTQLGERPSSYFLGLEKRQARDRAITSLRDDEGRTLTESTDILAYEKRFFEDIYTEDPSHLDPIQDFPLMEEDVPQVTESHRYINDLPFTLREFHSALKQLNKGKSPGSDGITPELYLAFWDILQDPFFDSMMFSLEQGTLSQEQRTGIITLIPKKNQIFSKALAIRIQSCIQDVVHLDQTGFIRGRTIGSNITNIQMLIDHTNITESKGLLLAVDYRKAFDTVRWDLIHLALKIFGFGEAISSAVALLFSDIKTCVINAGFSSGYFHPSRGIRQGCCCSPSLFVIAVELLAILVRNSIDIRGITIANRQISISQYADDATFFLQDYSDLDTLLELLKSFASMSGLHINRHKSHLLLLGHHLDPPSQYGGILIEDTVTILGIVFKNHMTEAQHYNLNFEQRLNKIRNISSTWLNRNLSMKGKVILISALMSSILQYPCSTTATPTRVLVEYKKIVTDFFWNNKRGKVAYNLLLQDIADGGIKLPDLPTRIATTHLYWIKHIWEKPLSIMALVFTESVGHADAQTALEARMEVASRIHHSHTFLRAIMNTWQRLQTKEPNNEEEALHQVLWDNRFILIQRQPAIWKHWREAGIKYINDLLHDTLPRFLSHSELTQKSGVTISFLDLLQIHSAIPCFWKRLIIGPAKEHRLNKPAITTAEGQALTIIGKPTKLLYYTLIKLLKPAITSQARWNELFPVGEDKRNEYWSEIYRMPYKTARDTKLQAFFFRLTHRFVPCNRYLKNIRIKTDDKCTFCTSVDTIDHFLFSCPIVQQFWTQVTAWLEREADVQLSVSLRTFLFGVPDSSPNARMINFILLFVKFFIYRQKLFHEGSLVIVHFLKELRLRLQVEKHLNFLENKSHQQHIYTHHPHLQDNKFSSATLSGFTGFTSYYSRTDLPHLQNNEFSSAMSSGFTGFTS